jgi:hypothetical protein
MSDSNGFVDRIGSSAVRKECVVSAVSKWSSEHLPPWFKRVTPVESAQRSLFPEGLPVVLATLRVSEDELGRWSERGWVSFGPDRQTALELQDVNEIRFVRDVARSGLSDAYIAELLEQLPRPLNFSPDEVAYSFSLGWVWVEPVTEPEPSEIVEQYVDDWLEDLAAHQDADRLGELRDRIDQLLTTLENGGQESND